MRAINAVASLLLTTVAAAPQAKVVNNCAFPVYLLSAPNDGSPPPPLSTLSAHGGTYVEALRAAGSAIKVGKQQTLAHPLTQGYTPSQGLLYYDLSDQAGNPFLAYKNTLLPTVASCPNYVCSANNATCYSDQNHVRVYACKQPVGLALTLCAA